MSTSGVYFELRTLEELGIPVNLAVEVETPTGKMILRCQGEIMRIEPGTGSVGFAVKITDSKLSEA